MRESWKGGDSEQAPLTYEAPLPSHVKPAPYHSPGAPVGSSWGGAGQPVTHVASSMRPTCPGMCPVFLTGLGPVNKEA